VVLGKEVQQLTDLLLRKAASIVFIVDLAGRWPDHYQICEHGRRFEAGKGADHCAYRVTDEYRVKQIKSKPNLDNVISIGLKAGVPLGGVCRNVGSPVPDIVEQNNFEIVRQVACDRLPHRLIAAEAMGEHHAPLARACQGDVMSAQYSIPCSTHHNKLTD
jgi:hypothetical protein